MGQERTSPLVNCIFRLLEISISTPFLLVTNLHRHTENYNLYF